MIGNPTTKSYPQPDWRYHPPIDNIQPWVIPMVPWPDVRPKPRRNPMDYLQTYTTPVPSFTGSDIKVELLVNGKPISEITHKGSRYFIASSTDATVPYTIKITNSSGNRVAVVVSVDGLSVMNGKNATQNDTAYVIEAYGSTEIKGWRRGDSEVAQFLFTEKGGSYASLTDRPTNVGVIGVIAYPEKQRPQPVYMAACSTKMPMALSCMPRNSGTTTQDWGDEEKTSSIGTGYGANIADKITSVSFERDYTRKVVLVYNYDSYESLVDRGVLVGNPAIKQPVSKPKAPTPFPGDKVDNLFCPSPHSRW